MKLYLNNSWVKHLFIGEPNSQTEAINIIIEFCKEMDFEIFYIRQWVENGEIVYDIGSHTDFFHLVSDDGAPLTIKN